MLSFHYFSISKTIENPKIGFEMLQFLRINKMSDSGISSVLCLICHDSQVESDDKLLLCDGCNKAYHIFCLTPPLEVVPEDSWFCGECVRKQRNFDEWKFNVNEAQIEVIRGNLDDILHEGTKISWIKVKGNSEDGEAYEITLRGTGVCKSKARLSKLVRRKSFCKSPEVREVCEEKVWTPVSFIQYFSRDLIKQIEHSHSVHVHSEVAKLINKACLFDIAEVVFTGYSAEIKSAVDQYLSELDKLCILEVKLSEIEAELFRCNQSVSSIASPADLYVVSERTISKANYLRIDFQRTTFTLQLVGSKAEVQSAYFRLCNFIKISQQESRDSSLLMLVPEKALKRLRKIKAKLEIDVANHFKRQTFRSVIFEPLYNCVCLLLCGSWPQVLFAKRLVVKETELELPNFRYSVFTSKNYYVAFKKVSEEASKYLHLRERILSPKGWAGKGSSVTCIMRSWDLYTTDMETSDFPYDSFVFYRDDLTKRISKDTKAVVYMISLMSSISALESMLTRLELTPAEIIPRVKEVAKPSLKFLKPADSWTEYDNTLLDDYCALNCLDDTHINSSELDWNWLINSALSSVRRKPCESADCHAFPLRYCVGPSPRVVGNEFEARLSQLTDMIKRVRILQGCDNPLRQYIKLTNIPDAAKLNANLIVMGDGSHSNLLFVEPPLREPVENAKSAPTHS